jgi:hypothetical protein
MPLIVGQISHLTEDLRTTLEREITDNVNEALGIAFPTQLGMGEGTDEFETARKITMGIMPGWIWTTFSEHKWAVGGRRVTEDMIARIDVLVLAAALTQESKDRVASAVEEAAFGVLSRTGKKVRLAVSEYEGTVKMTLAKELFADLMAMGADHDQGTTQDVLLSPEHVGQFVLGEIHKALR